VPVELTGRPFYIFSMCTSKHVLLFLALLCIGCMGGPTPRSEAWFETHLIDGTPAFGRVIAAAEPVDLLSLTPAMQRFVAEDIGRARDPYRRVEQLLKKMEAYGYFDNPYLQSGTYSAAETFEARRGNCVAYTNLFIALAREAGLKASYQLAHVPPSWNVQSGYLLRNNHINVSLKGVRTPWESGDDITVDFNVVEIDERLPHEVITDDYAASMFYANIGVEHLQQGNLEKAFAYLKLAILTEASNVDLWNNLGTLYSILNKDQLAEEAYLVALELSDDDKTALAGLAKVIKKQGRFEEAARYERLIAQYRDNNPFYHFAVAEQLFKNHALQPALESIDRAIALKRNTPRFHILREAITLAMSKAQRIS